jgi:Ca2+-binding RTX toxin-like protein
MPQTACRWGREASASCPRRAATPGEATPSTFTTPGATGPEFFGNELDNTVVIRFADDIVIVRGQGGNDRIQLPGFADPGVIGQVAYGDAGNDVLKGGPGDDSMVGGIGNDTLRGGIGVDRMFGDAGEDWFYARDGAKDFVSGGAGTDRAQRDASEALLDSIEIAIP